MSLQCVVEMDALRGSQLERRRPRVLAIDDEPPVLASIEALLDGVVDLRTTTSPMDALGMLEGPGEFDVVCSDYRMPGISGTELLRRVAERHPDVGCLLITGSEEYFRDDRAGGLYVLIKPFSPDRFVSLVIQMARVAQMKHAAWIAPPGRQTGRHRPLQP